MCVSRRGSFNRMTAATDDSATGAARLGSSDRWRQVALAFFEARSQSVADGEPGSWFLRKRPQPSYEVYCRGFGASDHSAHAMGWRKPYGSELLPLLLFVRRNQVSGKPCLDLFCPRVCTSRFGIVLALRQRLSFDLSFGAFAFPVIAQAL